MITLKSLPYVTAQEVFDQVARLLLLQNKKSRGYILCLYRGPNGLKCAAGHLIGDDEYAGHFEGTGTWGKMIDVGKAPRNHRALIQKLQNVHDMNDPIDWPEKLMGVAEHFGLKYMHDDV